MRESCISHKPKSLLLLIREDYFRLTKCDKVLAALLAVFEYWANGEISKNPMADETSIDLGDRTISEIEKLTLWIATDKLLRTKIKALEQLGFISISKGAGNYTTYTFHVAQLQRSLDAADWSVSLSELRKQNPSRCPHPSGLLTEPPPVNKPHPSGLLTEPPPVNKPHPSGLLTEPLYIEEIKNFKKEGEEDPPIVPQIFPEPRGGDDFVLAEVVLEEKEVIQVETTSDRLETEITPDEKVYSQVSIIPACENHSLSQIKPNGSEQFPWEQIDPIEGWTTEEGFLKYIWPLVKHYTNFKNLQDLSLKQTARALKNFINKAHYEPERREVMFGHWKDYQDELLGVPDVYSVFTPVEVAHQIESERIRNASKKKFTL